MPLSVSSGIGLALTDTDSTDQISDFLRRLHRFFSQTADRRVGYREGASSSQKAVAEPEDGRPMAAADSAYSSRSARRISGRTRRPATRSAAPSAGNNGDHLFGPIPTSCCVTCSRSAAESPSSFFRRASTLPNSSSLIRCAMNSSRSCLLSRLFPPRQPQLSAEPTRGGVVSLGHFDRPVASEFGQEFFRLLAMSRRLVGKQLDEDRHHFKAS